MIVQEIREGSVRVSFTVDDLRHLAQVVDSAAAVAGGSVGCLEVDVTVRELESLAAFLTTAAVAATSDSGLRTGTPWFLRADTFPAFQFESEAHAGRARELVNGTI